MKKQRILYYLLGIVIMSMGLSLNVKSYMGMAPVLTLPGVLSGLVNWEFSNMLFVFYVLFILLQFLLNRKSISLLSFLQFPIGLFITRLVAVFTRLIPTSEDTTILIRVAVLAMAIVVTGVGVAISVDMKIAPNPADGLASAVGERFNLGLGMGKNIVDITSAVLAIIISLCFNHNLGPVGIGTIAAGLLVGRVIALFNKRFKAILWKNAGIE